MDCFEEVFLKLLSVAANIGNESFGKTFKKEKY